MVTNYVRTYTKATVRLLLALSLLVVLIVMNSLNVSASARGIVAMNIVQNPDNLQNTSDFATNSQNIEQVYAKTPSLMGREDSNSLGNLSLTVIKREHKNLITGNAVGAQNQETDLFLSEDILYAIAFVLLIIMLYMIYLVVRKK